MDVCGCVTTNVMYSYVICRSLVWGCTCPGKVWLGVWWGSDTNYVFCTRKVTSVTCGRRKTAWRATEGLFPIRLSETKWVLPGNTSRVWNGSVLRQRSIGSGSAISTSDMPPTPWPKYSRIRYTPISILHGSYTRDLEPIWTIWDSFGPGSRSLWQNHRCLIKWLSHGKTKIRFFGSHWQKSL